MRRIFRIFAVFGAAGCAVAIPVLAQDTSAESDWRANYTLYGTPGLIDLPSAVAPADAEIAATVALFGDTQRATFTFQVLPRVTGSFRYSLIDTYDRSFDVQYQISDEGRYLPALAVGLRDFLGTGRYSSEYVVATKTITPRVRVSGGLGWGRLGSLNGFSNPLGVLDDGFETRPDDSIDTGGTILAGQFFRGDAAFFGGVEWQIDDDFTLLAEYSSDIYARETDLVGFERKSPLNFGVTWAPSETYQVGAYYMYGSEIGVSGTIIIDPKSRWAPSGLDSNPIPVAVRPRDVAAAATWDSPQVQIKAVDALGPIFATDGFRLLAAEVQGTTLRVRYENETYRAEAQGIGRVARLLTQAAPANIDTFILEPARRGMALSAVTLRRGDLEALENEPNAAALSYDRAVFRDASGRAPNVQYVSEDPAFEWGIGPYVELTLFDGDAPVRGDIGVAASFEYEVRPNVILSGAYRQRISGNRDEAADRTVDETPELFPVRTQGSRFGADGNGIENLSLSWYGRPSRNVYSRVSAGYFERQFGGVSGELLWKPVDSQFAFGAEVNYAKRRDFDLGFGFQDYDIVTGHVSAHYAFENGFEAQVDVGRYLAGDIGATFRLDRTFTNGWKVGAYFTLTDVPFDDFGEGSFDKGLRLEIPLDGLLGEPTQNSTQTTLSSLERDGGARLRVPGRLYEIVKDGHQGQLEDSWGRFWR